MLVYVLNKHGKPLMPCKPSKARKLLKQGKAKITQREPFTIQHYGKGGKAFPPQLKEVGVSTP